MSTSLGIEITPNSQESAALAKAIREHQKPSATTTTSKAALRTRYEAYIPGHGATLEIIRREPTEVKQPRGNSKNPGPFASKKAQAAMASYYCIANPADFLIGKRAMSSGCLIKTIAPVQIALFKAFLKEKFPSLPDAVLQSITDDNCKLSSLTLPFYFQYVDETHAYKALQDLHRHAEVVLNSSRRLPTRSKAWKKALPRVHSDPSSRHSFTIDLPFGQAVISLKRELDEYPDSFAFEDPGSGDVLREAMRCLLCIEIKVELRKFFYTDSDGLNLELPSDYRLWTPSKLPDDPAKIIWNAFRYELWFNVPLAVKASAIDRSALNLQLQEILDAYLAGKDVTRHERFRNDFEQFSRYHEALIKKSCVTILIPWAIHKLNLSSKLAPQLTYENRYNPADDAVFAKHTLSKETLTDAVERLAAAMQDKPGWMYDSAE